MRKRKQLSIREESRKWSGEIISAGSWCVSSSVGRAHRYQDIKVKFCIHDTCKKDAISHPVHFLHHNYCSTFKSPVIFVLIVCLCNFLQIREFSFKFAHCCCNSSERHKKRVTENPLASMYLSLCCVQKWTQKRAEAKRDERGEER